MFIIIIILGVIFFIALIVIRNKIANLRYRTEQHLLGKVGLNTANLNEKFNEMQESKHLQNLLMENPNFTEQSIKDTLYLYAIDLIKCVSNVNFSEKTLNQMVSKNLLRKMDGMTFERVNIVNYGNSGFAAVVIFTDGRDEYQISLFCVINSGNIYVDSIDVMLGLMKGF